jgi:hypothetical protein
MGTNPRVVTEERWISWDGVAQRLPKGQVMDVPPGSALERTIGREFLVPLGTAAVRSPAEPGDARSRLAETGVSNQSPGAAEPVTPADGPAETESQPAPAAPKRAPAKKQDSDDKDGAS